jgi:hypothetical protein
VLQIMQEREAMLKVLLIDCCRTRYGWICKVNPLIREVHT